MKKQHANSSVVAILVILLVIAGVLYLFWQNQQVGEDITPESMTEEASEESMDDATPAEGAIESEAEATIEVEVEAATE